MQRNLRSEMIEAVNTYLTIDNKKPESTLDQFRTLFSRSGEQGRLRAQNYLNVINDEFDDNALLRIVWRDLNGGVNNASLGTSEQLRLRLYQGLGKYFDIKEEHLDKVKQSLVNARRSIMVESPYGGYMPTPITLDQILRHALLPKVNAILALSKENTDDWRSEWRNDKL